MSWLNSGWVDVAATAAWFAFVAGVGAVVWRRGER